MKKKNTIFNIKGNIELFIPKCENCKEIPLINFNSDNFTVSLKCNNGHTEKNLTFELFLINFITTNIESINDKCKIHKREFSLYCKECKEDLCELCYNNKKHKNHIKVELKNMALNKNQIEEIKYKNKLRKEKGEEIINKLKNLEKEKNSNTLKLIKLITDLNNCLEKLLSSIDLNLHLYNFYKNINNFNNYSTYFIEEDLDCLTKANSLEETNNIVKYLVSRLPLDFKERSKINLYKAEEIIDLKENYFISSNYDSFYSLHSEGDKIKINKCETDFELIKYEINFILSSEYLKKIIFISADYSDKTFIFLLNYDFDFEQGSYKNKINKADSNFNICLYKEGEEGFTDMIEVNEDKIILYKNLSYFIYERNIENKYILKQEIKEKNEECKGLKDIVIINQKYLMSSLFKKLDDEYINCIVIYDIDNNFNLVKKLKKIKISRTSKLSFIEFDSEFFLFKEKNSILLFSTKTFEVNKKIIIDGEITDLYVDNNKNIFCLIIKEINDILEELQLIKIIFNEKKNNFYLIQKDTLFRDEKENFEEYFFIRLKNNDIYYWIKSFSNNDSELYLSNYKEKKIQSQNY